jgi:ankyrin repeat protein
LAYDLTYIITDLFKLDIKSVKANLKKIQKINFAPMLSGSLQYIRTYLVLLLFFTTGLAYSQVSEENNVSIDTSDYVSDLYRGAIDYNLMIAASKGYLGEINRLMLKGADILAETDQGVTALIFAVANNMTDATKILLDFGADPDKQTRKGETPLIIAVKNSNSVIAEYLIRAGAQTDSTDKFGATALHYSSVYNFLQITDLLLYYDASIDKKTHEGTTPLLAAAWAGNVDIADLLLQNGANIEAKDNEGYTPFLMAAITGDTIMMQLLKDKGADIYAVNNFRQNALTLSIISGSDLATKYLFRIGKKWSEQEKSSLNPYSVAAKYRRKEMISLLKLNHIPGSFNYNIDQLDIMISSRFFLHDIYSGISFSFKEPYLNGGILIGLDTKLWYTRVLQKQSEHTFYQYMSKGSLIYAGLFKDFALTDYAFKGNFSLTTSLCGGYTFGNVYKGTLIAPENKFKVIPAAGIKWTKNDLSLSLGIDYIKTGFYHVGPVWIRMGASYNLFFDNVRTKGKSLKWF